MNSFRQSGIKDRIQTNAGHIGYRARRFGKALASLEWLPGSRDQPIPLAHDGMHPSAEEIDRGWANAQPFRWGHKTHSVEREMLYSIMKEGEKIQGLADGYLRLGASGMNDNRVVAAATNRRLLLLRKGVLRNYGALEIGYESVVDIDVKTLTIVLEDYDEEVVEDDRIRHRHVRNEKEFVTCYFRRNSAPDFRFDIEDLNSVQAFAACLRKRGMKLHTE